MDVIIQSWFVDDRLQWLLLLVALDLALGVIAAFKLGVFRLSYLADFLRNDVVFKVGGWGVIYIGAKFAPSSDLVIPGFDLDVVQNAAWVIASGAVAGSLLKSLRDLGLFGDAPAKQPLVVKDAIAGGDPETELP